MQRRSLLITGLTGILSATVAPAFVREVMRIKTTPRIQIPVGTPAFGLVDPNLAVDSQAFLLTQGLVLLTNQRDPSWNGTWYLGRMSDSLARVSGGPLEVRAIRQLPSSLYQDIKLADGRVTPLLKIPRP